MLVSELIAELQKLRVESGNKSVLISVDGEGNAFKDIYEVYNDRGLRIILYPGD